MIPQFEYGTVSHLEDAQRLGDITQQCFNESPSEWRSYSKLVGLENFRFIRRAGEVVGGLAILQMGQWFGGRCVPMGGIASVGVSPEHRGTGVAVELLTQMLRELHANGVPISTLYAATQRPYRKVGYEQAGTCCRWELPLESIKVSVTNASSLAKQHVSVAGYSPVQEIRSLPVRSVPSQPEVFQELYQLTGNSE